MEIPGRKKYLNVDAGRAVIFCQPCQNDNDSVQAEGYCETCFEFLCTACIKAHQKMTITKNHVIKSKDEMPTAKTENDPCTELCAVHKREIIKFYCEEHDFVGCGDCIVLEHKSCRVQLVSDVSGDYGYSDELIILRHTIEHITLNLTAYKDEITQNMEVAEETKTRVLTDIHIFREEMNSYLDNVEADLINEVEQMSSKNFSKQKKLQDKCEYMKNEMKEFKSNIDKYSTKMNQLFVTSKLIQKRLLKYQEENEDISSKIEITTIKFEPSKEMEEFKGNISPLGKLSFQIETVPCKKSIIGMKAHYEKKVNIQAAKEGNCFITGMSMISDDEILLADYNNLSLKIVNVRQGYITSAYRLQSRPFDVSFSLTFRSAAVTLPDEGKILIMNYDRNVMSEYSSIEVRRGCSGIYRFCDFIVVTFCSPPAVHLMYCTGVILREVQDTTTLKTPVCIALANDERTIFVSDSDNNAVCEFTIDGDLKATIRSQKLKRPAGLVMTSNGTIVVCGGGEGGKVHMIVPDTREILPLLLQDVVDPWSILVSKEQNKMFICEHESSKYSDYIKIFDLK